MKKVLLSSLIAAAAAIPAFAGINNINYQAVIKDGNAVVANQEISLKFELLDKSNNVVYSEEQYPTTTETGYVSCQLGETEDLSTLNWGDLSLQVSVNLGAGFEVISKGAVSSVPTALHALTSADTETLRVEIDDFANMVEYRLDKLQNQVDTLDGDVIPEIEALVQDNEETKDRINAISADVAQVEGLANELEEFKAEYQENWQSLAKFQDEISTDINEFKDQYAEDWQSLVKFQEEISTDINEFKDQYAEDWQSLSTFQQEISTDINEFKADYQESFQKMSEFQDGVSTSITELTSEVESLVKENEDLKSNLKNLSADVAQIEGLVKENENLKNEIASLQEEVDSLRENLMELMKVIQGEDYNNPTPIK